MDRLREKEELVFKLGQLFGPLLKCADEPDAISNEERVRIIARFYADEPTFRSECQRFADGEPGHRYVPQMQQVNHALNMFRSQLSQLSDDLSDVRDCKDGVLNAIRSIPVSTDSVIRDARTPFATHCLLVDLCAMCFSELVWMDRYFDSTLFHRYLRHVRPTTAVTLVTWPREKLRSRRDEQRWDGFLDVSRLFSQERGAHGYRLLTEEQFHDRWLRCDDKMFSLGGSAKDISSGTTFTISRLGDAPENRAEFDRPLQDGIEVFGPTNQRHP